MGEALEYAPARGRSWRAKVREFARDFCTYFVIGGLIGMMIWPLATLILDFQVVRRGPAANFWSGLSIARVYIVDRVKDDVIICHLATDGHKYECTSLLALAADEPRVRREMISVFGENAPDDVTYAFLRGFTGQDLGNDPAAWQAWLKDHESLQEDPEVVYKRVQAEMDHVRGSTTTSSKVEAAAKEMYNREIRHYLQSHWLELVWILCSLVLAAAAIIVDQNQKRRRRLLV